MEIVATGLVTKYGTVCSLHEHDYTYIASLPVTAI